jgi:hypothetical protein
MTNNSKKNTIPNHTIRRRWGLILTALGFLFFVIAAKPGFFHVELSKQVIGYLQVSGFSIALGIICLGGTIALNTLWSEGNKSIAADLGLRVAWTGFTIAFISGMADIFGLGTRPFTEAIPFYGYWQGRGVLLGEIVIVIGFLMMIPWKKKN